jgi:hypothetical protein
MYAEMREMWLKLPPRPTTAEEVYCVAYEMGFPKGIATAFASADGSVSLYFSTGGGVLGCGSEERPRAAARKLLDEAQLLRHLLQPTSDTELPASGHYQVYALTRAGILTAKLSVEELKRGVHTLLPLFRAGDALVTESRVMKEGMDRAKQKPS